jgi:hypothetical protein
MAVATFGLVGQASAGTVIFDGLPYTSLGNATLQIVGTTLVVSNIGMYGNDGFSVALPPTTSCWEPQFTDFGARMVKILELTETTGDGPTRSQRPLEDVTRQFWTL